MEKPRIIIADDHHLFNEGIKEILSSDYEIVAQVFDGKDIIYNVQKHIPCLVLLDINMPHLNGMDVAKELKKSFKNLKVVFLTMYNEPKFVEVAKKIDIDGYLLKDSTKEELIFGLGAIIEGKKYFDIKLKTYENNLHHDDEFIKKHSLSQREIEIIHQIRHGKTTSEIAEILYLSEETIKSYRKNIHYKLGINKISELILFALENEI